ncbi:uncharacterized protein [Watersipora subatra]
MNSGVLDKQQKRKISYVLQEDIFLANLTCWETLWFTAMLRLPGSMPEKEKKRRLDDIVDALDMKKCLHTVIGDHIVRGLSGGERKRTSIACELLTNPSLMLLDEPTSGLDSSSAYSLCSALKNYAKMSGKMVIVSIHQPSSQIFSMFDKLLLLCDGQVAFNGSISRCAEYFEGLGLPCPPNYNLADHILDQVKDSEETKSMIIAGMKSESYQLHEERHIDEGCVTSPLKINKTQEYTNQGFTFFEKGEALPDVTIMMNGEPADRTRYDKEYNSKWPTSFWLQYRVLARRNFKQVRPIILSKTHLVECLIITCFAGLVWYQIGHDEDRLLDRLGLFYFLSAHLGFVGSIDAAITFPSLRPTMNKERLGGYYRLSAFFLAKISVDVPLSLVVPTVMLTSAYWLAGLNNDFCVFLEILLSLYLVTLTSFNYSTVLSTLITNVGTLLTASTTIVVVSMMSAGFYISHIPPWALWVKHLSFLMYAADAMITIDLSNAQIRCAPNESSYHACYNLTGSSFQNSSLPYIPTNELLEKHTLVSAGFELWHIYLLFLVLNVTCYTFSYISLRYIQKPRLA